MSSISINRNSLSIRLLYIVDRIYKLNEPKYIYKAIRTTQK